jgi:AcrR family transcriptional regulator
MVTQNPKFISIVAKGKELFWKYGIRRVSIEEICKEAGVSKMTYYKFFRNKNSLAIYLMNKLMQEQFKQYREVWDSDISMQEKVEKAIHLKLEYTHSISMELIQDIYKS